MTIITEKFTNFSERNDRMKTPEGIENGTVIVFEKNGNKTLLSLGNMSKKFKTSLGDKLSFSKMDSMDCYTMAVLISSLLGMKCEKIENTNSGWERYRLF